MTVSTTLLVLVAWALGVVCGIALTLLLAAISCYRAARRAEAYHRGQIMSSPVSGLQERHAAPPWDRTSW
jgi:hypothetical protein